MNELETRLLITKNGYDEEEVDTIMNIYHELNKHIGWSDNRRDKRYIVKFHDICYYTPYEGDNDGRFWNLFDIFCSDMIEQLEGECLEENIDLGYMLTPMSVGHYRAFIIDIPEITKENMLDKAMEIYNEFPYEYDGAYYVDNYIKVVNMLKDLEDNYMTYWLEWLRDVEYMEKNKIEKIREKYEHDNNKKKGE